jgi:uncharacterized repeat protein (TIGR01451 family)
MSCASRFDSAAWARLIGLCVALAAAWCLTASPAVASQQASRWLVTSVSAPTNFAPGDPSGEQYFYKVTVTNTGGANSDGTPVTITDELPEGLSLDLSGASGIDRRTGTALTCVLTTCVYSGVVVPDDTLTVSFPVDLQAGAPSVVTNVARAAGGGASDASMATPTSISSTPAVYGMAPGGLATSLSSTQAGAHADLTASIAWNTVDDQGTLAGAPKDTTFDLPPGFAGDLVDTPACSPVSFSREQCPIETQVGVTTLTLNYGFRHEMATAAVYNLAPDPGDVAKLGFLAVVFNIQGSVSVRPEDDGLRTVFEDAPQGPAELDNDLLTIWGVPADPVHDPERFQPNFQGGSGGTFGVSSSAPLTPFLTNPTACTGGALEASLTTDSWEAPGQDAEVRMPFGPIVGCDRLEMQPSLTAEPTTSSAYAPSGLDVTLGVPQTYNNAEGLATSTLKRAVVTLPEGMTVNPSAGAGLQGCTQAQFEEEEKQYVLGRGCSPESKLGSVKIVTPAIKEEGRGSVFLAQPYANPFKSLLALYVVARFPNRGVLVRVAGKVVPDPLTGRLVTTFDTTNAGPVGAGLPPLPFSTFVFSFRQGETSPLVTPPACGEYSVGAQLSSWADPVGELSLLAPSFAISSGFDGGACPSGGVSPFKPQVIAGTQSSDAGSYSPFDIRIVRGDGEQEITGFASQLPPGLTASLTGVPFCSEAQIALARQQSGAQAETEPACPAASQIGRTLVGAGVGSVLVYAPGKLYMAGPYEGAPFSIVAVTSAKVGPFDLGSVVVHLPLRIDPVTAAVSVPAGASDQIPHIIDGIVIHVRDIRVYVDRPNFIINPTNCNPLSFTATVIGSGASFTDPADDQPVSLSEPFEAANCARLAFKPSFSASTSGKTSRADGASLTVKLAYPSAPQGTQTNIAQVKVDLPKKLPSRLLTLQKACIERTFVEDPARCPAGSIIGHATAVTPILPVPLTGPAYFVSHGGAQFPEVVIVLQGYGVTLDLHGETFISKAGITSSTFRTVPDDPIGSFELTLPEGPDSALAANANLCSSTLTMPTLFVAQNGATIHQATPIAVTGCKPALTVLRHTVTAGGAMLSVRVPAAGRLVASGAGLTRAAADAGKAGVVTLTLKLTKAERTLLSHRRGRRLSAHVRLRFAPRHGRALSGGVTVLLS